MRWAPNPLTAVPRAGHVMTQVGGVLGDEGQVTVEAEVAVMQLRGSAATSKAGRGKEGSFQEPSEGARHC